MGNSEPTPNTSETDVRTPEIVKGLTDAIPELTLEDVRGTTQPPAEIQEHPTLDDLVNSGRLQSN